MAWVLGSMPVIRNRLAVLPAPSVTIDVHDRHQTIDGFGGSDAFDNQTAMSSAQADLFFDATAGIGLTYHRIIFDSSGANLGNWTNATLSVARGAKLWASAITAPAAWKDNASETNGGHLLSAHYDDWATIIVGFQATCLSNAGVNLDALSVQNEPDFSAPYVSMLYSDAEMVAFIKVLGPKVRALSPKVRLIAPESSNWDTAGTTVAAILADSGAAAFLDRTATHQYAGSVAAFSAGGRPAWETEMSSFDTYDGSITNGLTVAGWIHSALVTGNISMWSWWDLLGYVYTDNEGLIGHSGDTPPVATITKRFYVLGQFSKFIRPGYVRVGITGSVSGVSLSAFKDSASGGLAVVAINTNGSAQAFTGAFTGLVTQTLTPWRTSASEDLASQSAIPVTHGVFEVNLPASSVTTFVGSGA